MADRDIKELEETVRRMRKANEAASRIGTQPKKESNDLLQFFIGICWEQGCSGCSRKPPFLPVGFLHWEGGCLAV